MALSSSCGGSTTKPILRSCCLAAGNQARIAVSTEAYLENEDFERQTVASVAEARA